MLGRHRVCHREQDVDDRAVESADPGFLDQVAAAFEMRDHDPFGKPGSGGENVPDRLDEIGGIAGAEQRYSVQIDVGDANDVLGVLDKVGIALKMPCDVAHAICLQLVEGFARATGIDLPKRCRQILDEPAVSVLARL